MFIDTIYSTRVKAIMEKVSQVGLTSTDACNVNTNDLIDLFENECVSQILEAEFKAELNSKDKKRTKKVVKDVNSKNS